MANKFKSFEHYLKPDPRYKDKVASKFINCLMEGGKKSVAQKIFYGALTEVTKKIPGIEPVEIFKAAVNNVKPMVEVRSRRVGGATYQVPVQVDQKRQLSLAIRWILNAARGKKGRPMHEKLAIELASAYKREGDAMKKREDIHKMAEANKAFAHFAW